MSSEFRDTVVHPVGVLESPVEILVDRWGVSHIYAASTDDAFFAQGFNAARDRLWQIDLWRRRGLGLLSEVLGPAFVEKDRAARLFLYRGDMRAEWLAYGSDTKRVATAFTAGINEYVRLTEEDPELLPEEFHLLDYRPSRWSPDDVARIRSHGLFANLEGEVGRAITLRDFGPEAEALRRRLEPPHETSVPDGLDLGLLSDDVLRIYRLAKEPVAFGGETVPTGGPEGSNNWVISPSRTATGRPILANDPHRTQSVPSLRYAVHLSAPGMDVIGAGEPALPGVSIGHNGRIAFGLTVFSVDQEDLYAPRRKRYGPCSLRKFARRPGAQAASEPGASVTGPPRVMKIVCLWCAVGRRPAGAQPTQRDGTLLWSSAAGRLGLAGSRPVGRGDRFVVASATKLVVACAAMSMAERGELDIDSPVGRWLPDLPNAGRVTVRMLLSHRSGLPEYFRDRGLARRISDEPLRPWTRRGVLEAVARLGPEAEPGARYAYTDSNYVALGEILERQAGTGVERIVREFVARPLGLGTLSFADALPGGPRLASPHVALLGRVLDPLRRTGGRIPADAAGEVWTDGGLASSAEDLSAFTDALFGGRLLRPETVEAMTSAPTGGYGLGVAVWELRGARLLGHNGMYLGWTSMTTFDPRSRVTVSVLTNLAGRSAPAQRVEDALRGMLD